MPMYHLFLKKKKIPKRKIIGQLAFYPLFQKYSKGLCSIKLLLLYQISSQHICAASARDIIPSMPF